MNDAIQSIDHNRIINVGSVTYRSALFYCTPCRLVKLHASHKYSSDDSLTATPQQNIQTTVCLWDSIPLYSPFVQLLVR